MKTATEIMSMNLAELQRLATRLQVKIAKHERKLAGGGPPEDWPLYDEDIAEAGRVKREVYAATRPSTEVPGEA